MKVETKAVSENPEETPATAEEEKAAEAAASTAPAQAKQAGEDEEVFEEETPIGETLASLSWLWVTLAIVGLIIAVVVYLNRMRS